MLRAFCAFVFGMWSVAASANISLSPYFVEMNDAAARTGQVRFTNTSQSEKTYNIDIVNFEQTSDGSYKKISEPLPGNPFADPYLEWSPHQVTLQPGQSQVVRIRRRGMATAPVGEYVSHMLIQEQAAPDKMYGTSKGNGGGLVINLKPLYGVSIPVMIERGHLTATARIGDVRIANQNGKPTAIVPVLRSGNRSFYGTVVVSQGRRELGRISEFRIFMTTPQRVLQVPLSAAPSDDITVTLIDENTNETLETKSL